MSVFFTPFSSVSAIIKMKDVREKSLTELADKRFISEVKFIPDEDIYSVTRKTKSWRTEWGEHKQ